MAAPTYDLPRIVMVIVAIAGLLLGSLWVISPFVGPGIWSVMLVAPFASWSSPAEDAGVVAFPDAIARLAVGSIVVTLLVMNDIIVVTIRALSGAEFPGFQYFIGSFVGGALWPFIGALFRMPQRPQADPDHA